MINKFKYIATDMLHFKWTVDTKSIIQVNL